MESLRLTIPSQQEGQHILVDTNLSRLADWLRALPFADMQKTLPELTRAISSLNRTEINYKKRAELIEHFDSTYQLIHDYFRPKRSANMKNVRVHNESQEKFQNLTREMAFAHKIIIQDCSDKKQLWGKNKLKAKAMAFAVYYLGLMLIEQYENYTPIPMYLWREINAIYAHAGKDELLDLEIAVTTRNNCLPTIQQNYIRNCLIALADPYHLDKGEHWQVFYYLRNWIHLARISEDPDDFRNEECFIIDVTSENKPNFVTEELDDPEDPKIRLLLTGDLIRQIKFDVETLKEKNKLPENSFHPSISIATANDLWHHLENHWRQRIERTSRRYPIVTKVDVIWGISDITCVLEHLKQSKAKALSFEEIKELTQIKNPDNLTWNAINVSFGGIALCTLKYMVPDIKVGDLAMMREYMNGNPSPHWRLATCCWLTGDKNNGSMLGLKYIDGKFSPVRLVLYQGNNEKGGQPGIVVSDTTLNGSNAPTIITSRGANQGDRVYAMIGYGDTVEVRPRVKVEVTPCIERFFYQTYKLRQELAEEVLDETEENLPWTSMAHVKNSIGHDKSDDSEEISENVITLDTLRLPGDH